MPLRSFSRRETHGEETAVTEFAADGDGSVVAVGNLRGKRKAEAGAFGGTLLLYGERGVETSVVCLTAGTADPNRGSAGGGGGGAGGHGGGLEALGIGVEPAQRRQPRAAVRGGAQTGGGGQRGAGAVTAMITAGSQRGKCSLPSTVQRREWPAVSGLVGAPHREQWPATACQFASATA